jgi:hypothetical protein
MEEIDKYTVKLQSLYKQRKSIMSEIKFTRKRQIIFTRENISKEEHIEHSPRKITKVEENLALNMSK